MICLQLLWFWFVFACGILIGGGSYIIVEGIVNVLWWWASGQPIIFECGRVGRVILGICFLIIGLVFLIIAR